MWIKCGMITKAGEEAVKAKDVNALELLRPLILVLRFLYDLNADSFVSDGLSA